MYLAHRPEGWTRFPVQMHVCTDCVPEKALELPVADWQHRPTVVSVPAQEPTQEEIYKVYERLLEYGVQAPQSYDAAAKNPELVTEIIDQAVTKKLRPDQLHKVILWNMGWKWR